MLEDIKKELLKYPEKLREVLEHYGYCNVIIRPSYMQFGRDEFSSKKSIVIRLEDNDYLYVHDYARSFNADIFTFITTQRKVEFVDVLNTIKKVLNISSYSDFFGKKGIFGGFYERVRKRKTIQTKTYDDSILNKYQAFPNIRFIRDHIPIETQKYFDIRYDVESQGIVIPIRDIYGQLIGVKERFNYDIEDGEMKYFYPVSCRSSETLFGYSQNYPYLTDGTILIGEAEKFTMQCHGYKIRNAVSMMSGDLSLQQAKLIVSLHPKQVIFMHDQGYDFEYIQRNINTLRRYSKFAEFEIGFWDWTKSQYAPKVSATDMGKETFEYILKNEIVMVGDDENINEL